MKNQKLPGLFKTLEDNTKVILTRGICINDFNSKEKENYPPGTYQIKDLPYLAFEKGYVMLNNLPQISTLVSKEQEKELTSSSSNTTASNSDSTSEKSRQKKTDKPVASKSERVVKQQ